MEAAAEDYRVEVALPGVLRWLRRRRQAVTITLTLLRGLMPTLFAGVALSLSALRRHWGVEWVLPALRGLAAVHLQRLPPPLGFRPPSRRGGEPSRRRQQRPGPRPADRFVLACVISNVK